MSKVISIRPENDDKIRCDVCDKELWMLNSKTIRDQAGEFYMVCGSCYEEAKKESIHTI